MLETGRDSTAPGGKEGFSEGSSLLSENKGLEASGSLACWRNCQQLTWLQLMIPVGAVRRGPEGAKKAESRGFAKLRLQCPGGG